MQQLLIHHHYVFFCCFCSLFRRSLLLLLHHHLLLLLLAAAAVFCGYRSDGGGVVLWAFGFTFSTSTFTPTPTTAAATTRTHRSHTTTRAWAKYHHHPQPQLYRFVSFECNAAAAAAAAAEADPLDREEDKEQEEEEKDRVRTRKRQVSRDFVRVAGPALIQLTAEPLASLVDTLYLGRLGPHVLGGAGVAVSAQYAVSKLYNDPLLRTSISLVASQSQSQSHSASKSSTTSISIGSMSTNASAAAAVPPDDGADIVDSDPRLDASVQQQQQQQIQLSRAVSSALLLAGVVGVVQLIIYSLFGPTIITQGMGVPESSPMWPSAVSYVRVRAWGTPAATLWLVANGIFRGLGDTATPLVYALVFTALNALLDPLFIFRWGWGASGAAAGTALAQYAALCPLLRALHRKVPIDLLHDVGQWRALGASLRQYLHAGSLVLVRSLGKVGAYSVCARNAARLGSVAAAAYNLTFQLGFATTQICEAVAVAVQTLLAREMATASTSTSISSSRTTSVHADDATTTHHPHPHRAAYLIRRHLICISIGLGGTVSIVLSLSTWFRRRWILKTLTTNVDVQDAAAHIFPVVLITQVLKGLAYPVNGIIMGGLDWWFSMVTMWVSNVVCVGLCAWWSRPGRLGSSEPQHLGEQGGGGGGGDSGTVMTLRQIWIALAAFMGTQVLMGILRVESRTGVWQQALETESSRTTTRKPTGSTSTTTAEIVPPSGTAAAAAESEGSEGSM